MKKFNELVETPQWLPVFLQGAAWAWCIIVSTTLWMLLDNGLLGKQAELSLNVTRMNKESGSSHHSAIWVYKAFSLEILTVKSIGGTNSQEESAPRVVNTNSTDSSHPRTSCSYRGWTGIFNQWENFSSVLLSASLNPVLYDHYPDL